MKEKPVKIFVLLSRIPWPLEKGDKLRAFHQIKSLSKSTEIVLCALNTDPKADKQKAFRALQPYCQSVSFIDLPKSAILWNVFRAWITGKPLQVGFFFSKKAQSKINALLQLHKPDLIYGQLLRVAEYIYQRNTPKALDYQDVFSMGMKRRMLLANRPYKYFFQSEYKRLLKYEAFVFDAFDLKTIISYPDRELIPHPLKEQIIVVPNGVDHDFFKPYPAEKEYDILFTGNMAYPPNVNAALFLCEQIMPIVWKSFPNVKVLLAGATPDKQVVKLASKKVTVSGWLDDIRQAYASSCIFVAPMQIGTGLQNKLLEAMSMKLPCITTPLANEPLKAENGKHILVADSAAGLAENIITLLNAHELAQQLAENGYQFVHQHYNWDASCEKMLHAMREILPVK